MKTIQEKVWDNGHLIKLKDQSFLERQRIAGKIAAGALSLLEQLIKNKTTLSLLELDKIAYEFICDNNCSATFLNYKNFPNSVCISVNDQLVHSIPTSYHLEEGDLVSFDLGATFEGAIGDTAITCLYGEAKKKEHLKLILTTKECLNSAINLIDKAMKNKEEIRIGAIGDCIYKIARNNGFNVYTQYGGHGLEENIPHAPPFVANRALKEEGVRIRPGMTFAIEPLLVSSFSSTETITSKDGWTVIGKDLNAHEEHTVFVHENGVEIITIRENERCHNESSI